MNIDLIKRNYRKFGIGAVFFDLLYKAVNTVFCARIIYLMHLEAGEQLESFESARAFEYRRLTAEELRRFAQMPETGLTESFVEPAIRNEQICYAFLDRGEMASFLWYSLKPVEVGDGLMLYFDPSYVYSYHGITHPKHRGKRLFAQGLLNELAHYAKEGAKGIVCYTEANNYASQQSMAHAGFQKVGRVFILRILGKFYIHHDAACLARGFRVKPAEQQEMMPV